MTDDSEEARVARQLLAKNPKLRDAGLDTFKIVEKQKTARAGAKVPQRGGLDARALDGARERFEDALAKTEAEIARLEQAKAALKRAAQDDVRAWVEQHGGAAKDAVKQTLQLRRAFLDKIGWPS